MQSCTRLAAWCAVMPSSLSWSSPDIMESMRDHAATLLASGATISMCFAHRLFICQKSHIILQLGHVGLLHHGVPSCSDRDMGLVRPVVVSAYRVLTIQQPVGSEQGCEACSRMFWGQAWCAKYHPW